MDTPQDTTKSSPSSPSSADMNSTPQVHLNEANGVPTQLPSAPQQNDSMPSDDIGENNSVKSSSEINSESSASPISDLIKTENPAPVEQPASPSQSMTTNTESQISISGGGQSPKVNKSMLSVVMLLLGAVTGVFIYFSGVLKNDTLRLGEYTSLSPTSVPIQQKEKLIIGTDATYPPMEYKHENGNFEGYDIDLANEIGSEMGYDIEVKDIAFDKIFDALDTKEIDVIISSVTITEERSQKYNFSEPYINAGQVIVVRRNEGKSAMSTEDLKGKRVGVQKGTTSEEEALKYTSRNLVTAYSDYTQAVVALSNKLVDALIVDLTAAKGLVDENPTLAIVSDPFTNEFYGVVLRKDDVELKSQIDRVVLSLQKRGVLNNIKQKWFQ